MCTCIFSHRHVYTYISTYTQLHILIRILIHLNIYGYLCIYYIYVLCILHVCYIYGQINTQKYISTQFFVYTDIYLYLIAVRFFFLFLRQNVLRDVLECPVSYTSLLLGSSIVVKTFITVWFVSRMAWNIEEELSSSDVWFGKLNDVVFKEKTQQVGSLKSKGPAQQRIIKPNFLPPLYVNQYYQKFESH